MVLLPKLCTSLWMLRSKLFTAANTPMMQNMPNATPIKLRLVRILFSFNSCKVNLSELLSMLSIFGMAQSYAEYWKIELIVC
jgi:hypothetical protein